MRLTPATIAAGTALYAAVAGSTYYYINSSKALPSETSARHGGGCCSRFDRLAGVYDAKVGSEERMMLYGLMRWWLLRGLKGDVLEMSAGTGRNLQHYPLDSLSSLTLTDTSMDMLQVAEKKYYDQLKLGYKHPGAAVRFLVADAQHMVAQNGQAPVEVPLHRAVAAAAGPAQSSSGPATTPHTQQDMAARHNGAAAHKHRQPATENPMQAEVPCSSTTNSSNTTSYAASDSRASTSPDARTVLTSMFSQVWRHSSTTLEDRTEPLQGPGTSTAQQHMPASSTTTHSPTSTPAPNSGLQSGTSTTEPQSSSNSDCGGTGDRGMRSKFKPHSFDVVVDTFGLCSHEEPVLALREAAQLCRPGGHILLLEHGRSSWDWLNQRMDAAADKHFDKWGCWFNRDIQAIVQQAGLEVESSSRWHFGTTYLMVARPPAHSRV